VEYLEEVWLKLENFIEISEGGPGAGKGHVDSGAFVVGHVVVRVRIHRRVEVGQRVRICAPKGEKFKYKKLEVNH
jgi:hypothetical protein